jgi:hypothetical protein
MLLERQMAITLRNKVVEAKIREIGKRTGEGPSAVIARAIDMEEERLRRRAQSLSTRRARAISRLRLEARAMLTDKDRVAIRKAIENLHDDDGLPK